MVDPWSDDLARAPIPAEVRRDWLAWKKHAPVLTHGDEASTDRWLDSMSYGDLIVRELGLSRQVFRLSDPLVATGDYGVSSDAISAYAAKLLGLPGTGENVISDDTFSFPGGNAAILRHIVKAMLPEAITGSRSFADVLYAPINFAALDRPQNTRIRLGATAVAVRHQGDPEKSQDVERNVRCWWRAAAGARARRDRRRRRMDYATHRTRPAARVRGRICAISPCADPRG